MSLPTIESLIKGSGRLLAMPRAVGDVLHLLDSPNSRQSEIARHLEQDPALVAILLRLANSPAFAPARTVDSVERAIVLLGREHLRRLLVASALTQAAEHLPNQELLPLETFWRHSSYCAVIARMLAEELAPNLAGSVFLGGLLHDLGQLFLFTQEPNAEHQAFLNSLGDLETLSPSDAERAELGFDHAQLGGALAEHWGLPASLVACIRYHHEPLAAPEDYALAVAIIHVANSLAHLAEFDSRDLLDAPPIESSIIERFKLDEARVTQIIDEAQHQILAVEALRNPKLGE
ncbi:HD-like signal output (HDOD) domain, no enzymatic activity [Allochromatium warmingii]|uniref:HD-like signal output (HDOD) domain, no enzymatic activity n=2 Tax=Allochromatium warmingii TaxID=61595 RepID=A0A1H3E3U6_ALLWA|nr:HD-like signal output (HDOD) domain, no enzymatic activity [Allochromatium warmingii]